MLWEFVIFVVMGDGTSVLDSIGFLSFFYSFSFVGFWGFGVSINGFVFLFY